MSKKTRRHIWPVSLVMSIAIVGALAAFIVLATNPGSSSAHGGTPHDCSGLSLANQGLHDAFADRQTTPSAPTPSTAATAATAATTR